MKKAQRIRKSPKKPTILIAGGASLLGAALARRLLKQKCLIVTLDNLAIGTRTTINDLVKRPDFLFINCDINDELPSVIQSVDYIFHLAAAETHFKANEQTSLNDLLTNSLGTRNLLELARKSQAKFLLASSITVYQGLLSHLDLKYYFGASAEEQKKYSHAEAKRFAEALVWEYFENYNNDVRIARLSHIYGPGMDTSSDAPLGALLENLINEKNLIIRGEGLDKHYYTYLDDAVEGLVKALFSDDSTGKIFPLTDLKGVTSLELAHIVKRFGKPNIQIIHQPIKDKVELPDLKIIDGANLEILKWQPQISLTEGIERTLKGIDPELQQRKPSTPDAAPVVESKSKNEDSTERSLKETLRRVKLGRPAFKFKFPPTKTYSRKFLLLPAAVFLLFIYFFLGPILITGYNLNRGANQLKASEEAVRSLDFKTALEYNQNSQTSFNSAEKNLKKLTLFANLTGQSDKLSASRHAISAARFADQSLEHLILGIDPLFEILTDSIESINNQKHQQGNGNSQIFNSSLAEIIGAKESLQLAEAELKQTDQATLPTFVKIRLGKEREKLIIAKETLNNLELTIKVLPEFLGFEGPKKYLILFQNSNELRPTGGFIGSYAEVVFKDGVITDLKIDDIYNPDGSLDERNIRIEPPEPIRTHLGQPNWYLRDANWDVSFPEAALDLKRIYFLETGVDVDAIFAIDLNLVQNLLEVTGPISVATYNEQVEDSNLFEKAELHSAGGYIEGAPYKKTFLSALGQTLLEKIAVLEKTKYKNLTEKMYESLEEKHLLIYFPGGDMKKLIAERGWDGAVKETTGDFLYVVDANVGATKANFYITRAINYEVTPRDRQGILEGKLTLTYVHTGTSDAWPGGPYKNYLRILVPKGTKLKRASRSSEGLEEKGVDITSQINVSEESNKTTFATVFTLNHSKSISLTYIYELPKHIAITPDVSEYSLQIQKQPGTDADPLILSLSVPFGRTVVPTPAGFEEIGNILRYSGELKKDVEFIFPLK